MQGYYTTSRLNIKCIGYTFTFSCCDFTGILFIR
jgi:hypothetical protein